MTDSTEIIKCPACGKNMEKIFISDAGVNIDICTEGCGGIFFDNREFDKFNEQHEDIDKILEKVRGKEFAKVDTEAKRICPCCGAPMVRNTTKINGEVVVDDCYTCGGKFLDNNELVKIRAEYPTDKERSEAAIKNLFETAGSEINAMKKKAQLKTRLTESYFNTVNKIFRNFM
jgi:Zn-finger nucleic acid-binding protein